MIYRHTIATQSEYSWRQTTLFELRNSGLVSRRQLQGPSSRVDNHARHTALNGCLNLFSLTLANVKPSSRRYRNLRGFRFTLILAIFALKAQGQHSNRSKRNVK